MAPLHSGGEVTTTRPRGGIRSGAAVDDRSMARLDAILVPPAGAIPLSAPFADAYSGKSADSARSTCLLRYSVASADAFVSSARRMATPSCALYSASFVARAIRFSAVSCARFAAASLISFCDGCGTLRAVAVPGLNGSMSGAVSSGDGSVPYCSFGGSLPLFEDLFQPGLLYCVMPARYDLFALLWQQMPVWNRLEVKRRRGRRHRERRLHCRRSQRAAC